MKNQQSAQALRMKESDKAERDRDDRILIVGPSWVGDMVMAQSLFKVLQQSVITCSRIASAVKVR